MKYKLRILKIEQVTRDVKRFVVEKPKNFRFIPGQATYVRINKPGWKGEERPFTFTCLNDNNFLEFTIKRYPMHKGVTNELHKLIPGDELIITEPFGAIHYEGKGTFIAGGAGITPFIAILRQLKKDGKLEGNKLIFSNKTRKDIILGSEFKKMFKKNPDDLILTLDEETERKEGYFYETINEDFLKKHIKNFSQYFYICGPPKFVEAIKKDLLNLGAKKDKIVIEDL